MHVNVSGTLYSGKSAILDYLGGYECAAIFPGNDCRFVEFSGGLSPLRHEARTNGCLAKESVEAFSALLLGTAQVDGVYFKQESKIDYFRRSAKAILAHYGKPYEDAVLNAKSKLDAARNSKEIQAEIQRQFSDLMLFLKENFFHGSFQKKRLALYNNLVRPWDIRIADFSNLFIHVISIRNWIDQYYELRKLDAHVDWDEQEFCRRMEASYFWILKLPLLATGPAHQVFKFRDTRIVLVQYEDFASNAAARTELARHLIPDIGTWIAGHHTHGSQPFDEKASRKNIGIAQLNTSDFPMDVSVISQCMKHLAELRP